jgi:hypothetical protein
VAYGLQEEEDEHGTPNGGTRTRLAPGIFKPTDSGRGLPAPNAASPYPWGGRTPAWDGRTPGTTHRQAWEIPRTGKEWCSGGRRADWEVRPSPSHILTEVAWVTMLQTMVPIVTNDSGGTIYYGVVRKVGQNTYKVGQLFRPKVHREGTWDISTIFPRGKTGLTAPPATDTSRR